MRRHSSRYRLGRLALYLLILVILIYTIFPFYWTVISSLKPSDELFAVRPTYWPTHPTLAHYVQVIQTGDFLKALGNSAIVSVVVTLLSLCIGSLGAYALGRFRFKGRREVLYIVLAMTMFPQIAVLGGLFQTITSLGLYNRLLALMFTDLILTLPFTVWVLTNFFQAMPRDLEDAAYVDGATPLQAFMRVLLPLAAPGLVTTGLLAFIAAWNDFLFALSFTQTPDKRTVTVALWAFQPQTTGGYEIPWDQIMAATVIVTIPLILLALVFQKRLLAGLTAGAVKG
jgi:trehalose/maltose transport system permease protein